MNKELYLTLAEIVLKFPKLNKLTNENNNKKSTYEDINKKMECHGYTTNLDNNLKTYISQKLYIISSYTVHAES